MVSRYLLSSYAAVPLLLAAVSGVLKHQLMRLTFLVIFCLLSIGFDPLAELNKEGWREAVQSYSTEAQAHEPLLVYPSLFEQSQVALLRDAPKQVAPPIAFYAPDLSFRVLPLWLEADEFQSYFDADIAPLLEKHPSFYLLLLNTFTFPEGAAHRQVASYWEAIFTASGYTVKSRELFGDVYLYRFEKNSASATQEMTPGVSQ